MSTVWSDEELAASVHSYQKMLDNDRDGIRYVKTEIYKELARRFGRTAKAYEYRMTNISAVRRELGLPWVAGLLPLGNVGSGVRSRLIPLITEESPTLIDKALREAESEVTKTSYFDPTDSSDARKKVMTEIVRRRGQPAFRRALMSAYEGGCAITGCTLSAVLEAAHIYPYEGEHTNVVSNGLLLRADIHTLFDLGLIVIDSQSMTVQISVELQGTEYEALQGKPLRQTKNDFDQASAQSLDWHRSQFAKAS